MRIRKEVEANYCAVFDEGKTIRMPINPELPITELRFPEFLDVACNSKCYGNCNFCYTSSLKSGTNFTDVVGKIFSFFGSLELNQRPFQVALGGAGEPTLHPDFPKVLKAFKSLEIVPNYTTNGMHMSEEVLDATEEYCGGVALSCHPHLEKHWKSAIDKLTARKIPVNLHIIISDEESINHLDAIYTEYLHKIAYFVILPYMAVGRAGPKIIAKDVLEKWVDKIKDYGNIAFGSNFFEFLKDKAKWDISLYPPEIMSKYLILDDNMSLYNNSFEMKKVEWNNGVIQ